MAKLPRRKGFICIAALMFAALFSVLPAVVFPGAALAADGADDTLSYLADSASPESRVRVQSANGRSWLMLPSSADFERITLEGPSGAVLQGTVPGAELTLHENGVGEKLDLTVLFGSMEPGLPYPLTVRSENASGGRKTGTVILMKSAALNSLHIVLDRPVSEINASKFQSVSGSGYLVKLDTAGNLVAEAEVERLAGRGNASWTHSGDKRPYNFGLKEAAQLIDGAGVAKHWCLLSNNVNAGGHDRTGLYNLIAMRMFQDLNGSAALSAENVDLYINREYRGTYMLTERVEIQENRVNIRKSAYVTEDPLKVTRVVRQGVKATGEMTRMSEIMGGGTNVTLKKEGNATRDELLLAGIQAYQYASGSELKPGGAGGFLLELDFRFYLSKCWFVTRQGAQVVIREPEYASYEQVREIALFVQQMEDGLYSDSGFNRLGRHYSEYIDLSSLAVRFALDAFSANTDAFLASAYFFTDRDEQGGLTPICAGPAWDFDYANLSEQALLNRRVGQADGYPEMWMLQFLTKGDFMLEFQNVCRNTLRPLWLNLNEGGLDTVIGELSSSQSLNQVLWGNDFAVNAPVYAKALQIRYAVWYDTVWLEDRLMGVRIVPEGDAMRALVTGSAQSVRWFRVDAGTGWVLREVAGASDGVFVPEEDGVYVAAAAGKNVAYNPALKDNPDYKVKGQPKLVAQDTVTLYSAPFVFESAGGN